MYRGGDCDLSFCYLQTFRSAAGASIFKVQEFETYTLRTANGGASLLHAGRSCWRCGNLSRGEEHDKIVVAQLEALYRDAFRILGAKKTGVT